MNTPTQQIDIAHPAAWWAADQLKIPRDKYRFEPVSGDASFRQYFRLRFDEQSWVVVNSPPAKEDNGAFVSVLKRLSDAGIAVPSLLGWHEQQGYMLLEDFGDQLLLPLLNTESVGGYYSQAMNLMLEMQSVPTSGLPAYDRAELLRELRLFNTWFVEGLLQYDLAGEESAQLEKLYASLVDSALDQPQVFVHRDYHSRNIMLLEDSSLGLIDFQDAVLGPVTYDLASILRDCYVHWPREKVEHWVAQYQARLVEHGKISNVSKQQFLQWFDWMGLQRHIKVLGVFARLKLRDGKTAYMNDLPLVLAYTLAVAKQYHQTSELSAFVNWFESRLMPIVIKQAWYKDIKL